MSVEISPGGADLESPDGQSREEAGTLDAQASTGERPSARISTTDLDNVNQKRSDVKAGGKNEPLGSEKTLGRKRQR
jgi:hypothetical protein